MFTGIVETLGTVLSVKKSKTNKIFSIQSPISEQLKIDQSVLHNGVCLTVVQIEKDVHQVVAIEETLQKTHLSSLKKGDKLNLERCLLSNGRFDGHIVQGHVDQTAVCEKVIDQNGSWRFYFSYDPSSGNITVPKGSICVNGVSLTVVDSSPGHFSVAIIPYTYENTTFGLLKSGEVVNLEFDIVGKYLAALVQNGAAENYLKAFAKTH